MGRRAGTKDWSWKAAPQFFMPLFLFFLPSPNFFFLAANVGEGEKGERCIPLHDKLQRSESDILGPNFILDGALCLKQ